MDNLSVICDAWVQIPGYVSFTDASSFTVILSVAVYAPTELITCMPRLMNSFTTVLIGNAIKAFNKSCI